MLDQGFSELKVGFGWAGWWPCCRGEGRWAWLWGRTGGRRVICMGKEDIAHKQNSRSPLPTEVGLRDALHLTCLGRCVQPLCGFSWHLGPPARSTNSFVQGKASASDGCKQQLLTETHPCALRRKASSPVTGHGHRSKGCLFGLCR